jgi:hypothetical protein
MTIEVPLPDLTTLPVWAYVTGGVWAWYLTAAVVVRGLKRRGWFDLPDRNIVCIYGKYHERGNLTGYDTRDELIVTNRNSTAIVAWVCSPPLLVITALWSSAHVMSLGLVPRPWSRSTTA